VELIGFKTLSLERIGKINQVHVGVAGNVP
jgi:hypothetical protein